MEFSTRTEDVEKGFAEGVTTIVLEGEKRRMSWACSERRPLYAR